MMTAQSLAAIKRGSFCRNAAERGIRIVQGLHILSDIASVFFAYALAWIARFILGASQTTAYPQHYFFHAPLYILVFILCLLFIYASFGLYSGHKRLHRTPLLWNLILSNGIVDISLVLTMYFAKSTWHMRGFLPLVPILNVPITFAFRIAVNFFVSQCRKRNRLISRVLLIGDGKDADEIERLSSAGLLKRYRVVARRPTPKTATEAQTVLSNSLSPEITDVFMVDQDAPTDVQDAILFTAIASNRGCVVCSTRFLTLHNPFHFGDRIRGVPLVHYSRIGEMFPASRARMVLEAILALVAVLVLSPVFLIIAIAIKLNSRGPVFFSQDRYGLGGKKFRMFKFRTMVENAESEIENLRSKNETDGALFKLHDDPRVTRVGAFLRKTSLDELPQLFNVILGQMRIVGPRPLPCADIEPWLDKWQGLRHGVHPGITCVWQAAGRSEVGFEGMSLLDVWYVFNRNPCLDARIILRTAWCVIFQQGAY